MFDPVYATAAARHDDIVFGKVDTEAQRELAMDLGIISIPTLLAFRDGTKVKAATDALPLRALDRFIADVRAIDMATFGRDPIDDIPELDMSEEGAPHVQPRPLCVLRQGHLVRLRPPR